MKNIWKQFEQPTPKNFVRLGYALLGCFSLISGTAIYTNNHTIAYIAIGVGVLGKFLTDFFTEK